MANIDEESLKLHKKYKGKLAVTPIFKIKDRHYLALAYTPGVAAVSKLIAENKDLAYDYTWRWVCGFGTGKYWPRSGPARNGRQEHAYEGFC